MIIRCIDFETTGIPTEEDKHAIVEIGWCDLDVDGTTDRTHIGGFDWALCDPGRPIPPEAMAVHHITDEMVKGATGGVHLLGEPAYFAAHRADYERSFFETTIPFICTYKVALRVWPDLPAHGLQFLRYALALPVEGELPMPHRAGPDAYLCALLLEKIIDTANTVTLEDMVRWSSGPALLPRVNFGKHKGAKWEDVPIDYLEWVANKSDLDRDVKANARHHLKARAAVAEAEFNRYERAEGDR
jgi:exodeoxyribonuclease X